MRVGLDWMGINHSVGYFQVGIFLVWDKLRHQRYELTFKQEPKTKEGSGPKYGSLVLVDFWFPANF